MSNETQGLLFNQGVTANELDLLPGAMRSTSAREDLREGWGPTCSWCGIRPEDVRAGGDVMTWNGRTDATWSDPIISWGCDVGVTEAAERICPFCVHRPTDQQRAIEVARLVAQAKGAA